MYNQYKHVRLDPKTKYQTQNEATKEIIKKEYFNIISTQILKHFILSTKAITKIKSLF